MRRHVADRSRSLLWWAIGATAMVASTAALYRTVEGNESFEQLAAELPPAFASVLGMDGVVPITSAPGYLQARVFSTFLPLMLLIFSVALGARAIAGAEDDGTLELTVAQPISRRSLALETVAAVAGLVAALTLVVIAGLIAAGFASGALDGVSLPGLLTACSAAGCLALLHGSIAFAVGAAGRGRGTALGVAGAVAIGGYALYGLTTVTPAVEVLRFGTPWHWYLERNMLAHGPSPVAVVLPLVVSAVLVAVGIAQFDRRDLHGN